MQIIHTLIMPAARLAARVEGCDLDDWLLECHQAEAGKPCGIMLTAVRDSLSSVFENGLEKMLGEPADIVLLASALGAVEGLLAASRYLDEDPILLMTADLREAIDQAICVDMLRLAKQRVEVVSTLV